MPYSVVLFKEGDAVEVECVPTSWIEKRGDGVSNKNAIFVWNTNYWLFADITQADYVRICFSGEGEGSCKNIWVIF